MFSHCQSISEKFHGRPFLHVCHGELSSTTPPPSSALPPPPLPLTLALYSNMERLVGLSRKVLKAWAVPGREGVGKPSMTIPRPALAALRIASFL